MKLKVSMFGIAALLCGSQLMMAQAPAGSTGQCKDGSYTTAASKSGACRGHKGIQTWYAATSATTAKTVPASKMVPAPKPAAPAAPAPAMAPAPKPAPAMTAKPSSAASRPAGTPAAGGGPGMVWVNTSSKVYHCPGTKYYGTTKGGKYMAEKDAIAAGNHADHGNACTK
jgi:hypothetical protein